MQSSRPRFVEDFSDKRRDVYPHKVDNLPSLQVTFEICFDERSALFLKFVSE